MTYLFQSTYRLRRRVFILIDSEGSEYPPDRYSSSHESLTPFLISLHSSLQRQALRFRVPSLVPDLFDTLRPRDRQESAETVFLVRFLNFYFLEKPKGEFKLP